MNGFILRETGGERRTMNAEEYFERIPDGHENSMPRPYNPATDRRLRDMIAKANQNGDCIINNGNGIFRPVPGDPEDERQFSQYLRKELARARAILYKRMKMKEAFKGWQNGIFFKDQRQA